MPQGGGRVVEQGGDSSDPVHWEPDPRRGENEGEGGFKGETSSTCPPSSLLLFPILLVSDFIVCTMIQALKLLKQIRLKLHEWYSEWALFLCRIY